MACFKALLKLDTLSYRWEFPQQQFYSIYTELIKLFQQEDMFVVIHEQEGILKPNH